MLNRNKIHVLIVTWTLIFSQSVQAVDLSSLSEQEINVAKKIGLNEEELKSLDTDALKDRLKEKLNSEKEEQQQEAREKLQAVVREKIEPAMAEVKTTIEKEKVELKKDATKLAAGYITSTISLFAATLIAPQVIMVCKTKPSAVVYAGTAAVYVFQEMRNIKILKASQLAEIEVLDNITIDKNKSVKENAKKLESKVDQQIGYIKAYKNTLDSAVIALKNKAKNAKLVSIGFMAASATAAAEQMDWISGGGTCVTTTSLEKINFSKQLDTKYAALIEGATRSEDKWAYYYEWESLKFGVNRTLSISEYQNLKKTQVTSGILVNAMKFIQSNLLASALAAEDSKKVVVAEQLKNNKAADWLGDLDKLGIVGGLAINVVAYISGWQMGFLKSVMASGTSRAVVFGVQGALAFTAGKLFESAADNLEKKLAKVDDLINKLQGVAKNGINVLVPSDADARRFKEVIAKLGLPSDKLITEMSVNEASAYINNIKAKEESLDEEGKALLKRYEDEVKSKLKLNGQEKLEEIKTEAGTSSLPNFINYFFPEAMAAAAQVPYAVVKIRDVDCVEKKSCPPLKFPKENNVNLKILNQYLGLYEKYYQDIKMNNQEAADSSFIIMEKNKNILADFRAGIFKKAQEKVKAPHRDYNQYERVGITNEVNKFSNFYNSLPPEERLAMDAGLNPASTNFATNNNLGDSTPKKMGRQKSVKLAADERRILTLLIDRLEASEPKRGGPDMTFVERDANQEDDYNFGNTSIHPKEANLFEIIHIRHLQFMKKTLP